METLSGNTQLSTYIKVFVAVAYFLFIGNSSDTAFGYTYQSYNGAITCTSQLAPYEPKTVRDIQLAIILAGIFNKTVKVIGSKHSISDCLCTEGLPIVLSHFTHFSHNPNKNTVTAGTGMQVIDFLEKLHTAGCAISGAPTFGGVTLGGAIALGVHGTGGLFPTLLSDQLASLSFVDGQGNDRRNVTEESEGKEKFNALRVSLGLLGIIYEVEIQCQPLYKLKMHNFPVDDSILKNGAKQLMTWIQTTDVVQFWWFPVNQQVVISMGNRTDPNSIGTCQTNFITDVSQPVSNAMTLATESMQRSKDYMGFFLLETYLMFSLYQCVPGRQPFYSESDGKTPCDSEAVIGWSHKMMSNKCTKCPWLQKPMPLDDDDSNVAFPLRLLPQALEKLRKVFEELFPLFPLNGLYFRILKPGEAIMALNHGNDWWVSLEWVTIPRWDKSQPKLATWACQAMAQILIESFEGRPHWGKAGLVYTRPDIIKKAHGEENVKAFVRAMDFYDPEGRFMNTFGERIRGINEITIADDFGRHCGLNECSFCQVGKNKDCGNGDPVLDNKCFLYEDQFPVCKPSVVELTTLSLQRVFIETLASTVKTVGNVVEKLNEYGLFTDVVECGIEALPCEILKTS